ncbi:diguanylate cyclase [uncultured Paraglaciecola sp.]|uniref:GGDEF domain-containing protein n=1 Tax=uncultured Paraglaciecola sp. TaxID=1765024 RepID=UPI0025961421|nr:diguanylate cyclase [uncultured Paraglaciecola sp.]
MQSCKRFIVLLLLIKFGIGSLCFGAVVQDEFLYSHALKLETFSEIQAQLQGNIVRAASISDEIEAQFSLATLYMNYDRVDLLQPLLEELKKHNLEQQVSPDAIKWHILNGYAYYFSSQYGVAEGFFNHAFSIFKKLQEERKTTEQVNYLYAVLTLYASLNSAFLQNYSDALVQLTSLNVDAQSSNWPLVSGMSLYHLGIINYELKNYEQALEIYRSSKLAFPQKAKHFIALAEMGEAQMINIVGERQEAFSLLDNAIATLLKLEDKSALAFAYLLKSYFYSKDENHPESLRWIAKSVQIREQLGNVKDIANAYVHYADILFENNKLEEGLEYAKRASELVADTDDLAGQWDAYAIYAVLLSESGDYQQAFEYMSKSERALLAKARLDITAETARLNSEFNLQKEQLNNQYLDEKNKRLELKLIQEQRMQVRQSWAIFGLLMFVAIILLMLAVIYKLYINNKKLANIDSLTGLPNRRCIFEVGERLFNTSQRYEQSLCLLMIDVDNFKLINDTYGHDMGDEALKFLASVFNSALRKSDCIGRIGGEEFLIILPNSSEQGGILLANRLIEDNARQFGQSGMPLKSLTFSIGLVNNNSNFSSFYELVKVADDALYKAKNGGRNQVQVAPSND